MRKQCVNTAKSVSVLTDALIITLQEVKREPPRVNLEELNLRQCRYTEDGISHS